MGNKRNWRNPEDYEYSQHLTSDLWAWQFLRRNPEYQEDWKQAVKKYEEKSLSKSRIKELVRDMIISTVPIYSARKWGLIIGFVNPEKDIAPESIFVRNFGEIIMDPREERRYRNSLLKYFKRLKTSGIDTTNKDDIIQEELELFKQVRQYDIPKGSIAVTFDLSLPIEPQIRYAEKILKECQKEEKSLGDLKVRTPRQHVGNWQNYLRIWDAKAEGADNKEIAAHLFPKLPNEHPEYQGNRMVKDSYKAAKKLVNKGYLKLLVRDPLEIL